MRRLFATIFMVILCAALFSCGKRDENMESPGISNIMTFEFGRTDTYGEKGILSVNNGILWLADLATGDMAPICTIPNCEHKGNKENDQGLSCDAYVGVCCNGVALIDDSIYYVSKQENFTDYDFYKMDVTGKNRKVICSISDVGTLTHAYCTKDYYFLSFSIQYDENNNYLECPTTGVLIIDLKSGELKKKEFTGEYALCIDTLYSEKDSLFFSMSYTTEFYDWTDPDLVFEYDSWMATFRSVIYRMDLATLQVEAILSDEAEGLQNLNGGVCYGIIDGSVKSIVNLKTSEISTLDDFEGNCYPYGIGENQALVFQYDDNENATVSLYDVKNQKVLSQISYDHGMGIHGISGDKVFVSWGSGSAGDMPWRYISLKEFQKGDATVHEIVQPDSYWD